MDLLDSKTWMGCIYLDGWRASGGGERHVVEPSTGNKLARVGVAAPADIATAAARASEAQCAWAAASYETRAGIPVAPVIPFETIDQAIELARDTEYGLSLAVLTRDVMKGLAIADRIPSGNVHINDQTVTDEVVNPFGGVKASGAGTRLGGPHANLEAFTEVQWVTVREDLPAYPF